MVFSTRAVFNLKTTVPCTGELDAQGQTLHASLPSHIREVVNATRLLLFKRLLKRFAYPDLDVVEFMRSFFFARCCLGKILGGAPFSQLHKGDKQSRTDR